MKTQKEILVILSEIPDPEIPVINIKELGVLRDVIVNGNEVEIIITPTYSGCPAMKQIQDDIISAMKKNGIENTKVKMVYHPAWTTDWITDEAKEKLKKYGIAPPEKCIKDLGLRNKDFSIPNPKSLILNRSIACPQCGSENTEMVSQFGSTACKALYKCLDCKESFDYFKCH
ncbi:MAG: phenylacetate-CoA oxygenase subunit PaaJ [Bacteroidetes bacterium]|nr:phenylacetate-CoA oxygenase subunit PaaJ [Bacteroidota bacterium]